MRTISPQAIARFRRTVLAHYRAHARGELLWRRTRDPYRILVSEIMLQQTQVARVVEKYPGFVGRFPTAESLARAPLRDVMRAWNGLGYNRRAVLLREAARTIVTRFGGAVPRDLEALLSLPGVGPATAAGVLTYAFNEPHPFIETNIRAVFIHHFCPGKRRVADAEILPLVERTLDRRNPRRWFSALMDYGTALKKEHGNPARRSAVRASHGRYEGSDRQARGLVVRALTRCSMTDREVAKSVGLTVACVRAIIPGLVRDGLVSRRKGELHIP